MSDQDSSESAKTGTRAPTRPPGGWRRAAQLSALATSTGVVAKRFRTLRISCGLLALSGVVSVLVAGAIGAADIADIVALRILAYACWLCGALGLWALLAPDTFQEEPNALAELRGQELNSPWIRWLSYSRRLATSICWGAGPGLITALIVSGGSSVLIQRGLLLGAVVIYVTSLSLLLGAVGTLSATFARRSPRSFALTIVVLPFLLSLTSPEIPSIPGVYIWALGEMIQWGGAVA